MATQQQRVHIGIDDIHIDGVLDLPAQPIGVVLFAHGSGSSRHSPRNNYVAAQLRTADFATLLLDLLTPREDQNYQTRFDIALLTSRLGAAAAWLHEHDATRALPLGLFGASTGAAAALQLAADPAAKVAAVVSRGGRPDMAGSEALAKVQAPTLLIVGGLDEDVLTLNRAAYAEMHCKKHIDVIPGATHLFEEAGALPQVASLAEIWFARHFAGAPA